MKNALIVIDAQQIYSRGDSDLFVTDYAPAVENINKLIDAAQANGELVIYVRHQHAADGTDAGRMFDFAGPSDELQFVAGTPDAEFMPELKIIDGAPIIIKNRYSCFVNTDLEKLLKENGIEKVTLCGFMTNFCVDATARHAHDLDYFVDVVLDACGTPGTEELSPIDTARATAATLSNGVAVVKNIGDLE